MTGEAIVPHGAPAGGPDPVTGSAAYPRLTLAATILGSSVAFIDGSVINVALPALASDLRAGPTGLSWTINAYLLPLGALTLIGGAVGDRYGRRLLFLLGLGIFTLASLVCALAPSLALFLAGRALQGLGAAVLLPNSLALLGAGFEGAARGRAIGIWAACGALIGALGPLAGGWLVDTVGWRAIFLINLPIAAVAAALASRFVGESRGGGSAAIDWPGGALVTLALLLLTGALTEAAGERPAWGVIAAMALGGVAAMAAFLRVEIGQGERAIVPLAIFAARPIVGLSLLTLCLYAALGGMVVLLPFVLIEVGRYSAVAAGAAILPLPVAIGLASPFMGAVATRYGARPILALGCAAAALGLALLLRIGPGPIGYAADILPTVALVALGMALCVAPLTASVMEAVDRDHVGVASGFNSAIARVGGLLATAALGFVFARQANPDAFLAGIRIAAAVGAALAAVAGACALLLDRKSGDGPPGPG